MRNIEKDLEIDRHGLEEELLVQAPTFHYWLMQHVNAQRDKENTQAHVDETVGQLADAYRASLTGSKAPTETAVKQAMSSDQSYMEAMEGLREANHTVNVLGAAVKAMDSKKRALENLVELRGQDWHSRPKRIDKEAEERSEAEGRREHTEGLEQKPPTRKRPGKVSK